MYAVVRQSTLKPMGDDMQTDGVAGPGSETSGPVLALMELGFQWPGLDPFIMTMHHMDHYPSGNED
jgi:hypothetical protein